MKQLISILFLVTLFSCKKDKDNFVTYNVGCEDCSLTYRNKTGGTEQQEMKSTWTHTFNGKDGQFLYISAQNNKDNGQVTVTITIDGETLQTATSKGAYVIATASGNIPD